MASVAVKVYGERNTGTNYLEKLVTANLDAYILSGIVPRRDPVTFVTRNLRALRPELFAGWHEKARDWYFARNFSRDLGWKHMCPDVGRIGAEHLGKTRFLMLVKNPYSWLVSFFRRPYHGTRTETLDAFVDRPFPVMTGRENADPSANLPAQIWNQKNTAYVALEDAATYASIVRYEDFLEDEEGTLSRTAEALSIPKREAFESIENASKVADTAKRSDYVDYYLQEKWREDLNPAIVARINGMLDQELVERLGYARIESEHAL